MAPAALGGAVIAVAAGILPLKLDSGADGRELDRARLLLASLARLWHGAEPFQLFVVVPEGEWAAASRRLVSDGRIAVTVFRESDFFEAGSPFFRMRGMYKQQIIKIFVPASLSLGGFLTFDADVVCIRPFDERSFVRDGRLVSTWESRRLHSWWPNGMSGLSISSDLDAPGLGVTPNLLHSDLCAEIPRFLERRGLDPLGRLHFLAECRAPPYQLESEKMALAWSEYSLYTMVGEDTGRLHAYHLAPAEVAATGMEILSRRSVWSAARADRLRPDPADPAHFLVVQSWAGVPVEDVAARCGLPFVGA